jgi:hypothetical protein
MINGDGACFACEPGEAAEAACPNISGRGCAGGGFLWNFGGAGPPVRSGWPAAFPAAAAGAAGSVAFSFFSGVVPACAVVFACGSAVTGAVIAGATASRAPAAAGEAGIDAPRSSPVCAACSTRATAVPGSAAGCLGHTFVTTAPPSAPAQTNSTMCSGFMTSLSSTLEMPPQSFPFRIANPIKYSKVLLSIFG